MNEVIILTILTTILLHGSSIPQFIRNYKRKKTDDISISLWIMVFLGYIGLVRLAFIINSLAFKIIYIVGLINIGLLVSQIIYYRRKK